MIAIRSLQNCILYSVSNRYLHINPTEEWTVQPNLATPSSTPSSTRQVPDKLHADNPNIANLVQKVGKQELSVKDHLAIPARSIC